MTSLSSPWAESGALLAWAVRHGEVPGDQALDWITASPGAPELGHAAALWPVLEEGERTRLASVVNESLRAAPLSDLATWMGVLTAQEDRGPAEAFAQSLLQGSRADETAMVWALALPPSAWPEAFIRASAAREDAASILGERVAASSPDTAWPAASLRVLLHLPENALALAVDARTPHALAELRARTVAHLPTALLAELIPACEATMSVAPEASFRALLGAWSRLPAPADAPHENLRRAHEVLVRAAGTSAACLAAVSPHVPDALVDEAARLQRQAQSPERPAALSALAARTPHPAVRRRLFHEAYHETRFRRDRAQLRSVIVLAAPHLPEDATAWLAELPDELATWELAATLLAQPRGLAPGPLVARARAAHREDAPFSAELLLRLVAATPEPLAEAWIDAAPVREPMRTRFWDLLGPKLPPPRLAVLLADAEDWGQRGPERWWTTSLVALAPPELVRVRLAADTSRSD